MISLPLRPALALSLLALGGCAAKGTFPSLAPRAVERLSMDEPVRTPPAVPEDAQLEARIAALVSEARQGEAEFQAALGPARARVGRAGGSGSESWVEAQVAVSRLQAARAQTARALTTLDALSVERANAPTNAGQFQLLLAAVETVTALAEAQQATIDGLRARL